MQARFLWILALAAFGFISAQGAAFAGVSKCKFDVWTTTDSSFPSNPRVDFYLELEDSTLRPPEALKVLTITAPSGTGSGTITFDFSETPTVSPPDPNWKPYWKFWSAGERYFFFYRYAKDFPGGIIPAGTYTLTVVDKTGRKVVNTDTLPSRSPGALTAKVLPLVKLTYPAATTDPLTVVPLNGKITWTAVAGAQYYRVILVEDSANKSFVYDPWRNNPMHLYGTTSLTIPRGDLQAGYSYWVRIEARDSDKSVGARSRTQFIKFKAGE